MTGNSNMRRTIRTVFGTLFILLLLVAFLFFRNLGRPSCRCGEGRHVFAGTCACGQRRIILIEGGDAAHPGDADCADEVELKEMD